MNKATTLSGRDVNSWPAGSHLHRARRPEQQMTKLCSTLAAKSHHSDGTEQRGMALLIVLWIVLSAGLIVSSFVATVHSGLTVVQAEVQLAKTEGLLDAGVEIAAARLLDVKEPQGWLPNGVKHTVSFADAELTITISDPNGLVDINKADKNVLFGFFRHFAESESRAGRLRDLIIQARGERASEQDESTDGQNKQQMNLPLPFVDIAQLRDLDGMESGLFDKIAPFVTVYSRDGHINSRDSPSEVLLSIPNLTKQDVAYLHDSPLAAQDDDPLLAEILQRAGLYLTDKPGPAYVVTVEVRRPGISYATGEVFVIATGLDPNAPYRLLSKRPSVSLPL
jgi:general secretion pathway protein K